MFVLSFSSMQINSMAKLTLQNNKSRSAYIDSFFIYPASGFWGGWLAINSQSAIRDKFFHGFIIGIVFISLMFANNGYAKATKAKILEKYEIKIKPMPTEVVVIVCIQGYKFIHTGGGERNMIQFFEDNLKGQSVPAKC